MDSPFLGIISCDRISGGAATLIILEISDKFWTRLSKIGGNCSKFLYEISQHKDVHLKLDYPMQFEELELDSPFEGICVDTGERFSDYGYFSARKWDWLEIAFPSEDCDLEYGPIELHGGSEI